MSCCQKRILSSMKNSFGSNVDTDDVNTALENLLRLEIYYKQFNYEGVQETPGYTVYTTTRLFCINVK